MPQDIISQFDRKYNAPIETFRQVVDTNARDSISPEIRWAGMLVYVTSVAQTYQLVGGIDNTDWQPLAGLSDAPSDGNTYGRQNGSWSIITSGGGGGSFLFSDPSTVTLNGIQTNAVLKSYTVPANTINKLGDTLIIKTSGVVTTAPAGSALLALSIDGFVVGTFNASNANSDFITEMTLSRNALNQFRGNVRTNYNTTTGIDVLSSSWDETGPMVIELLASLDNAANSVTAQIFSVEYKSA